MNKWIKRGLVAAAALVVLAGAVTFVGAQLGDRKSQRQVNVPAYALALRDDAVGLDRGKYLYSSRGCAECHGADGAGRPFIGKEGESGLFAKSPNISPGAGSVTLAYGPADWERALRHGVKPDGRPVFIMPSEDYSSLTDDDVASLVAYVKHMPPASGDGARFSVPLPVRVLYGFGAIKDSAEKIDHTLPPAQPVPPGVTVAHGAYVANMCIGCHGAGLSGGKIPGGPPEWPAAANLTQAPESPMSTRYADAQAFAAMFKSGHRPDGSVVQVMPFESLREMNEVDVQALHVFLKSLAPRAGGNR